MPNPDEFKSALLKYVSRPPIKARFGPKSNIQIAKREGPDNGLSANQIHFPTPAAIQIVPIFILCDKEPQAYGSQLAEFYAGLRHLKAVPQVFFVDGRQNILKTLNNCLKTIHEKLTPPPTLDLKLHNPLSGSNRYASDFEEIEMIGEGGFGKVFKVKSRLDNAFYAVKKIRLKKNDTDVTGKIKEEIQLLASLNHPNVIRYHCGWVGEEQCTSPVSAFPGKKFRGAPFTPVKIQEITDEEEIRNLKLNGQGQPVIEVPETPLIRKSSSDSNACSFASLEDETAPMAGKFWNGGDSSEGDSDIPESAECSTLSVEGSAGDRSTLSVVESSAGDRQIQRKISPPSVLMGQPMTMTLYIQMELCTTTLEEHLRKRNHQAKTTNFPVIDGEFNRSLCIQLLSALQYIHGNKIHIIHRDIKPANIFLKPDGRSCRILLGDFGLACGDSIEHKKESEEEETNFVTGSKPKPPIKASIARRNVMPRDLAPQEAPAMVAVVRPRRSTSHSRTRLTSVHSIGVGTTTYAAPEQLTQSDYCSAVDIYSAGIVLYEAYNIFSTSMERLRNIEKLRSERKVTEYLEKKWPSIAPVILSMTEVDPSKRPTAGQLLQRFKGDESASNLALQEIINSLNEKIVTLEKALAAATTVNKKKPKKKTGI